MDIKRLISDSILADEGEPTAACPSSDRLLDLLTKRFVPGRRKLLLHISNCRNCSKSLADMAKIRRESAMFEAQARRVMPTSRLKLAGSFAALAVVVVLSLTIPWQGNLPTAKVNPHGSADSVESLVAYARAHDEFRIPSGLEPYRRSFGSVERGQPAPEIRLISPVATWVEQPRTMLAWQTAPEGTTCIVRLGESTLKPAEIYKGKATKTAVSLVRGHTYRWQVLSADPDHSVASPVGTFRVISLDEDTRLQADLAKANQSKLQQAAVYAQFGLLEESQTALEGVEGRDAPLAQKLLAWLKDRRRRIDTSPG